MKKNLLYSLLTSGTLLLGGLAGYAVSTDLPLLTQNTRAEQSYTVTPENGGTSEKAVVESFTTKIKFDFGGDVAATATNPDAKITVSYNDVALTRYNRAADVMYWDDDDIGEIGFVTVPHVMTGNLEICLNPRMFNTPGVLKIHIDEGCFSVNGIGTPEVDYTHTFGETVPVEAAIVLKAVSPEESKEVKSLKSAVLYLDVNRMGEAFAMFDESKLSNVTIAKDGGEPSAVTSVAFDEESYLEGAMGYKVTFPELTEAGVYTLTVGAGCFYLGTDTTLPRPENAVGNDVITAKFTVNPDAKLPIEKYVVMSPEQSPVKIKSISSVVIDFPEVSMLGIDDTAVVTLTNTVSKKAYKGELGRNWSLGGMHTAEVFFYDGETPVESVSEAGTYELEIAAGAFADGEELSNVIKATFNVDPALVKEYSWTATPQNLSKIAIPEGKALQIEFAIEDAETVDCKKEWEDPNHDPQYGTKVKSVVVTYNGESVPQVKNAWASENAEGWSLKDNWGDPYIIIGVNSAIFSRPGILQVSIDQGMYTVDEENPSPAINYSITVGDLSNKEYEVKVSPKMDLDTRYMLEDFKEFTIEFLNAEKAEPKTFEDIDDDNNPVIRYDVNPHLTIGQKLRYFGDYTIEKVADAAHPTFKLKFTDLMSDAMQEAASLGGWLELSIDKDSFILDDGQPSPAISQTWTLKRTKEIDTSWEASPTGDIVNEGYGLYANFKFNDDETLSLRAKDGIEVKLNGEVVTDYSVSVSEETNVIIFDFVAEKYCDKNLLGTLSISIPAGAVYVSGEQLGAIAHTWNIVGMKEYSFKCNPENGATVSSLAEIIVEIPEAKTAVLHNINNINLRSSDYFTMGAVAPKSAELLTEGYDHPAFKLVFDPAPTVDTEYTLVFYYDAFYIDNAYGSVDATFKYTLDKDSGVEDVLTGKDNKFTVVSIDGKLLYKDASSDQIKALDKGIYIINGKKVVIK